MFKFIISCKATSSNFNRGNWNHGSGHQQIFSVCVCVSLLPLCFLMDCHYCQGFLPQALCWCQWTLWSLGLKRWCKSGDPAGKLRELGSTPPITAKCTNAPTPTPSNFCTYLQLRRCSRPNGARHEHMYIHVSPHHDCHCSLCEIGLQYTLGPTKNNKILGQPTHTHTHYVSQGNLLSVT